MDWDAAIEWNRAALTRVLAALVAMVRSGSRSETKSPEMGFSSERTPEAIAESLAICPVMPRRLHRAVLRLLRPAEAAARRLVIAAARGLAVELPPPRPRKARPPSIFVRHGVGTGIVPPAGVPASALLVLSGRAVRRPGGDRGEGRGKPPRRFGFRLFDPLPRFRPARPAQISVPRISAPGFTRPIPLRPPVSPNDPVQAAHLALRLAALGRVLDDLPRQAKRFARWRRRVAAGAQREETRLGQERRDDSPSPLRGGIRNKSRTKRIWPLRPGRPPGLRPASPEIRQALENTHGLALMALAERHDTS